MGLGISGLSLKGDYAAAIGVLAGDLLISLVCGIPADYMNSMVVEQKYGFNRMTKKTFILDQIKEAVIGLALTASHPTISQRIAEIETAGRKS